MWDLVEKKTGGREKIKEGGEEMRGREKGREGRRVFFTNQKPALGVPAIGIF